MSRAVTGPNRAREYETIYILKPDVDADTAEKVGGRVAETVAREAGKLTARERVAALVDEGSFEETGLFATHRATLFGMEGKSLPADGVVTGAASGIGQATLLREHGIDPEEVDEGDAMRQLLAGLSLPDLFLAMWSALVGQAIDNSRLDKAKDPLLITADRLQVDVGAVETTVKLARKQAAAAAKVKDEKPAKAGKAKQSLKDAGTEELEEAIGMAGEPVAETLA